MAEVLQFAWARAPWNAANVAAEIEIAQAQLTISLPVFEAIASPGANRSTSVGVALLNELHSNRSRQDFGCKA